MDRGVELLQEWTRDVRHRVVCSDYNSLDAGDNKPFRLFFPEIRVVALFTARCTSVVNTVVLSVLDMRRRYSLSSDLPGIPASQYNFGDTPAIMTHR